MKSTARSRRNSAFRGSAAANRSTEEKMIANDAKAMSNANGPGGGFTICCTNGRRTC